MKEINYGFNRKVINRLRERKLDEGHLKVIMEYLMGEISWLEAHNKLIPMGINLTNDEVLADY